MFKFGFELEGFYTDKGEIQLPPKHYSTDGFPGLCEIRTVGGGSLEDAYFSVLNSYRKTPFDLSFSSGVFSPQQRRQIRQRENVKDGVDIQNIYGKEPRLIGNKTLASLQVNISYQTRNSFQKVSDKGIIHHEPETYGLFDFVPIIRALDEEFEKEIKKANRQAGFYSIKDGCRVEYRSLPNTVFETELVGITKFLDRIIRCIPV